MERTDHRSGLDALGQLPESYKRQSLKRKHISESVNSSGLTDLPVDTSLLVSLIGFM